MQKLMLLSLFVPLVMAGTRVAPGPERFTGHLASPPAAGYRLPPPPPGFRPDTTCAPVTFVTRPVTIMKAGSLPERYTPTTVPLCPGAHAVRFRGTGLDTVWVTIEVASDTPQHHLVRVPRRGIR